MRSCGRTCEKSKVALVSRLAVSHRSRTVACLIARIAEQKYVYMSFTSHSPLAHIAELCFLALLIEQ